MKRIKEFLGTCSHKWIKIEKVAVYETWSGKPLPGQIPAFHKYVLECKNCGDIRVRKV